MAGMPTHCGHCGKVFLSPHLRFTDSTNVTVIGGSLPCPFCGKQARPLDGTFDFVGNSVHVLKAPPRTIEILRAVQEALKAAQAGASEEAVIAQIEEASPELAAKAKKATATGGRAMLISLLILFLAQCTMNVKVDAALDLNVLFDQVLVSLTGAEPHPHIGKVETAPPTEQKSGPNRHQRRQQEHQSRKQKQPSAPQTPRKK